MNSRDYLIPKDIYDELFSDYMELVQKEEQLEQELEKLKKPINYYQYASKNLKDKNEQLQQQNKKYKEVIDKAINDINLVIELIKQQPTEDDSWILGRLNAFKIILKGVDNDWNMETYKRF